MALLSCDFFAETLEVGSSMTVVLPQQTAEQIGVASVADTPAHGFPLLYLLHGLSFTADDDLFELLAATGPGSVPPLYIACGTEEDRLMPANVRLADAARARRVAVTTDFRPGVHEWGFWDDVTRT